MTGAGSSAAGALWTTQARLLASRGATVASGAKSGGAAQQPAGSAAEAL